MPKAPILKRRLFFEKVRGGSMRLLDWAVVETSLGTMVEPRTLAPIDATGSVRQVDVLETTFDTLTEMREDKFYEQNGTSGQQVPLDWKW